MKMKMNNIFDQFEIIIFHISLFLYQTSDSSCNFEYTGPDENYGYTCFEATGWGGGWTILDPAWGYPWYKTDGGAETWYPTGIILGDEVG